MAEKNGVALSALIVCPPLRRLARVIGVLGNPGYSDLNNTHWTIKQVDLIKALTEKRFV
jgi:hypothetical protein